MKNSKTVYIIFSIILMILFLVLFVVGFYKYQELNDSNKYLRNELNKVNLTEQETETTDGHEEDATTIVMTGFMHSYYETLSSNPYVSISECQEYLSDDVVKMLLCKRLYIKESDVTDDQIKNIRSEAYSDESLKDMKTSVRLGKLKIFSRIKGNKAEVLSLCKMKIAVDKNNKQSINLLVEVKMEFIKGSWIITEITNQYNF